MTTTAVAAAPEQTATEKVGLVAVTTDLKLPPRDWLIDQLWPEQGVGFIAGLPKVKKSWLALDLTIAICTGGTWLGRRVLKPGPVFFFSGEEFLGDIVERLDRLLQGRALTRKDVDGRLFISEVPPCLEDVEHLNRLVEAVREGQPKMVFFDPLARSLRKAEENSATEMRVVTNFVRQDLTRRGQTAVGFAHHTDKHGGDMRGTGDLRALSEITLRLHAAHKLVRVEFEMRGAKAPEPVHLEFCDDNGGVVWKVRDSPNVTSDRVAEARRMLAEAGSDGTTTDAAMRNLHVRWDVAKSLLKEAGGRQAGSKGRWYAGEFLAAAESEESSGGRKSAAA